MNFRRFWIVNGKGDITYLTEKGSRISLSNPKGLGYSNSIKTIQYSNVLKVTNSEQEFGTIDGDLLFFDSDNSSKYEMFNQFVSFLNQDPLMLYYQLPTNPVMTYHVQIGVKSIGKTEIESNRTLNCDFSFQILGRWRGEEITITGSGNSYTIINNGHMPCGFEITIEGVLTNPYFTLEQGDELYGEAKFDDSTAFNSVYVDSNDGQQEVILEQGGSVLANPLSYQDLSISNGAIYVTFIKLARGESALTIGMDSGSITSVEIKYTPLYRSV